MELAFDNEKYLKIQKEKIEERIKMFDNKLYLEFGGKIFDDYNASRVLPGFSPDAKIKLLQEFKENLEIIFCINANNIQENKIRADYGISYDVELLRLIENISKLGIEINSVVITMCTGEQEVEKLKIKLEEQENVNQGLVMKINEMASLDNVNAVSTSMGLAYNNENIKNITE